MKILHVSKYFYPYIGGIENTCKQLVDYMPEHQIAVICFNEGNKDIVEKVSGTTVYRVATWINISRQALSLSYFGMLHKALKEFQPDIIHFHWANPFPAAVLLTMIPKRVKLVVHWHMDIIKQVSIYPFIKPIETAFLKRADMILVTSPNYRDGSLPLQRFKKKIRVLPSAIDVDGLRIRKEDEEHISSIKRKYGEKKIVFFIGRHIQYKGLSYLIEAEPLVKSDCVFVIGGIGPLTSELKQKCKSKRVYFTGRLSEDELRCYYYAASVFAFPSITKNEAFGLALAEAMCCGTPAVTFTISGSGVNWVSLNGITGLEVSNGDVGAYAQALDCLLSDDFLCRQYSQNGITRVKANFTIPVMIEKMKRYYEMLMQCEVSK